MKIHIHVPDTPKYVCERINQGSGYELEIWALYNFYGHKKGVQWLKNRLEAIDKNLEKDIKHS